MKIVLATIGSRGDVQPMIALCLALQAAGHQAILVGPPERASWAAQLGCTYQPMGDNVTTMIDSLGQAHTIRTAVKSMRYLHDSLVTQFEKLPGLTQGADLVIGASLSFSLSSLAEAMKIPYRYIAFTPQLLPSAFHPCPVFRCQRLPGWCNRLSWRLALAADRYNITRLLNRFRQKLGLEPVKEGWFHILGTKLIVATDPAVAALPADRSLAAVQTGYIHLDQPARHVPELENFLASGPPPLYAGFGSMPRSDQKQLMSLIKVAARQAGQRLVLARFWLDHCEPGETKDIFYISRFPHARLFPRMGAIIHHGGAGTTATAAISGRPQIIVPHILDQYFWAHQVYRSGCGPRPIHRARLTALKLTCAIRTALDSPQIKKTARKVQTAIFGQNSTQQALKALLEK